MRNVNLLMLFPMAFASQAANVVDYSQVDLSQVLNPPTTRAFSAPNQPLAYQDASRVKAGPQTLLRKQQLHYGVPVYGQSLVAQVSAQGTVTPVDGKVLTGIDADIGSTLPMLNAKQAIELAKGNSQGFASQAIHDPNAELMIWQDEQQIARLVYKVDFIQMNGMGPSRPITLVDAKSGDVLDRWEGIAFIEAEGPGGNRKSGRYYFGPKTQYGGFEVNQYCQMDSPNVITLNMNNQQYGGQVHQFDCNVNNYRSVNGAYAPMNDAHYFGQRVFDMYMDWLNTRPIQQKLTMRVHYGSNYGNAFWDGRQMTFGDGNQSMYPLATWDVIAHEVSHGFTEQNSGLEYRGMSGGMNESFSDVAAAALSQYVHGSFNWKMGEHVMKYSDAMRYFIQPSKDGVSIDHINQYYNGIDVHHSSGVFNKAFYHLATSSNWDIKKAFIAYATANQLYWRPNSDFQQGAEGVCKAAHELGYDTSSVNNAFAQVGIQVAQCASGQPDPEPTPNPDIVSLQINIPSAIESAGNDEQHFVLKNAPAEDIWVQTYNGYGNVDMYVAINRPASLSDHDCASTNRDNNEYCGFSGVGDADVYVMVTGARSSSDAYVGVSAYLEEPTPEPQDLCANLEEWSPYYYYPQGTEVQSYGNRFIATQANWGADPYSYYWYWSFEGSCLQ
ncbi:peptidase M4 family protein [Vibrio coralliilyticus]|uniref:M4 family metallopeptidase n=1 Tax=Vibrio coralliilyticus TaxID=190893 RepID=UPI00148C99C0|nr:M4 family metallopeptidase [Vibrio coralliilyticus]NOH52993.1 peptidase M4 family protein [Vibrio coralliilyticus]